MSYDINLLNKPINPIINELLKGSLLSSIVIDLSKPCATQEIRDKCKTDTCKRPSVLDNNQVAPNESYKLFIDEPGIRVDLRKVKPDYTGYKEGASEVWKSVYKIAKDLKRLVSGIQFSVTVHMAVNYAKDKHGKYMSNFSLYKMKYKEEYEMNAYITYMIVRSAVIRIKFEEAQDLIETLKHQGDLANIKWRKMWPKYEIFFDSADQYLDCIECGTCKLWGKVQFRGLKAAIDVLKSKEILEEDKVYLLNFFGKLSNTVEDAKMFDLIMKSKD